MSDVEEKDEEEKDEEEGDHVEDEEEEQQEKNMEEVKNTEEVTAPVISDGRGPYASGDKEDVLAMEVEEEEEEEEEEAKEVEEEDKRVEEEGEQVEEREKEKKEEEEDASKEDADGRGMSDISEPIDIDKKMTEVPLTDKNTSVNPSNGPADEKMLLGDQSISPSRGESSQCCNDDNIIAGYGSGSLHERPVVATPARAAWKTPQVENAISNQCLLDEEPNQTPEKQEALSTNKRNLQTHGAHPEEPLQKKAATTPEKNKGNTPQVCSAGQVPALQHSHPEALSSPTAADVGSSTEDNGDAASKYRAALNRLLAAKNYQGAAALKKRWTEHLATLAGHQVASDNDCRVCQITPPPLCPLGAGHGGEEDPRVPTSGSSTPSRLLSSAAGFDEAALLLQEWKKKAEDKMHVAEYKAQLALMLEHKDYQGAARLQKEQKQRVAKSIAEPDYTGLVQMQKATATEGSKGSYLDQAAAEGHASAEVYAAQYKAELALMLEQKDYKGAARLQKEQKERMAKLIADHDYTGLVQMKKATASEGGKGSPIDIKSFLDQASCTPTVVQLKDVYVLSMSKVNTVPIKGKGKGKAKGKGKGKEKGKAVGKDKSGSAREECQAIYVTQEGHVACIMAFGAQVVQMPKHVPQGAVRVYGLRAKQGYVGILTWEADTKLVCLGPFGSASGPTCPYMNSAATDGLATCNSVHHKSLGEYVDFVIKVNSAQEYMSSINGEPYLRIHGFDMENNHVWPLFMWRFKEGDLVNNRIYILRGMKVVKETQWCVHSHAWMPFEDARQKIECSFRTAVEDVTDVQTIKEYFW